MNLYGWIQLKIDQWALVSVCLLRHITENNSERWLNKQKQIQMKLNAPTNALFSMKFGFYFGGKRKQREI